MKTVTSVYIHSSEKSCFVQKGRMVPICLHCLNCTKFGQLILRQTIKIIATRGQILRLKCTKFDFGWGSLQRSLRVRPPSLRGLLLKEGDWGAAAVLHWGRGAEAPKCWPAPPPKYFGSNSKNTHC